MAKVGRFITDPKAGAYCQIVLDSGEKITVSHDKGGFKGGHLAIEVPKWMGMSSDRVFECDLDGAAGKAAIGRLTQGAPPEPCEITTKRPLPRTGAPCHAMLKANGPRCTGCSAAPVG